MRDVGNVARLFVALVLFAAVCSVTTAKADDSKPVSPEEIARLRPAVQRDLRKLMQSLDHVAPSDAEVRHEFKLCKFSRLNLGPLGEAFLVEAQWGHGNPNAAMLNIYIGSVSGYHHIVEGSGFGPYVLPHRGMPPDLVFGWTSGVCTAKYYRYHYAKREYEVNGCAQEDRDHEPKTGEYCAVKACDGEEKYSLFDPPVNKMSPDELPKSDGPSCVPAPALEPSQAIADSTHLAPLNQVQFMLAGRSTGDCQPASIEEGTWTTSDTANTQVTSKGLATCLHPTSTPALITFTGSFHQHNFPPASLICK